MDIELVQEVMTSLETALRNGMSLKQIKDRVPASIAKRRKITVPEFHAQLNQLSNHSIDVMVNLVVAKFTNEERDKIAKTL